MAKLSQQDRILALLKSRNGGEVALSELWQMGIAQYNARIMELRRMGYDIRNRTKIVDGQTHSWYWLVENHTEEQHTFVNNIGQRSFLP